MSDELRRIAKAAILKTVAEEGQPGILGRSDGVLYFTDAQGIVYQDRVWCRIGAGDAPSEAVVRITTTPRQLNLPVIVATRNGQPTVIRGDTERATVLTGGRPFANVAEHASSHGRTANDPLYIAGPAFLPLMAVPSNPLAMTVDVQQGFYRYQGTEKVFLTTTSGSLSAHVPASQNQQKFVVLSLDRSTNTLTVTAGTTVSSIFGAIPFDAAAVLAIVDDLNDEHFPIAAIRFYYGQTRITAADIFMDLRLWGGEALQGSEELETVDRLVVFNDDFVFFNEEPVIVEGDMSEKLRESSDTKLATVAGIDAKTVAQTTLFTVPTGRSMIVTQIVQRTTAFTVGSKTVQAIASFGGNAATYDDYIDSATYTVAAVDKATIDNNWSAAPVYATGTVFKLAIETGSNATTETWSVDVFGYLV